MDASVELVKRLLTSVVHIHTEAPAATGPRERRVSGGLLSYLGEFEAQWEYMLDRSLVSTASNPGFGGGPLFTVTGRMVGVVSLNLGEIVRSSLAIPGECYLGHR